MNTEYDLSVNNQAAEHNYVEPVIIATAVAESNRLGFLPKHFGPRLMSQGESLVFAYIRYLADNYNGGMWEFYELSNGGFYLAPKRDTLNLSVGTVSGDAAGIIATMYALNHMMCNGEQCEKLRENYFRLRDFAYQHTQSNLIHRAID